MCGIVGVIKLTKAWSKLNKDMFTDLLYAGAVRGQHSTGVFKVFNGHIDWRKAAAPVWDFFNMGGVPEFFNTLGNSDFICGHNRYATRGNVTNDNAHPFEIELPNSKKTITLVHNGTLSAWNLPGKFEVDSQAITNAIAVLGVEETSKKLDGAYSLVWYNSEEKTLNFLRNKERPMWLAHSRDFIMFGSEPGLLRWIAGRYGQELEKVYSTEVHTLYSFSEGEGSPVIKTVEPYRFQHYQGTYPSKWLDNKGPTPKEPAYSPKLVDLSKTRDKKTKKMLEYYRNKYKVGNAVEFSVEDFSSTKNEKFITVIGDIPDNGYVMVKGNFGGDMDALAATKNLLRGEIAQVSILKHEDRVMLFVKNISFTDKLDPFFIPKEEPPKKQVLDASKCSECEEAFVMGERGFVTLSGTNWECLCLKCRNVKLLHEVVEEQQRAN